MPKTMIKLYQPCLAFMLFSVFTLNTVSADTPQIVNCDGYPCVNFSFGANVSRQGEVFGSLFFNRPQLGEGLDPLGGGQFHFVVDNESHTASECTMKKITRKWPFAYVHLEHPRWQGVTFSLAVWVGAEWPG